MSNHTTHRRAHAKALTKQQRRLQREIKGHEDILETTSNYLIAEAAFYKLGQLKAELRRAV